MMLRDIKKVYSILQQINHIYSGFLGILLI